MKIPRVLLTAGASGSGKTLITCGLLQAFMNRGLKTASFKCGPDYIDPMFHSRVIGTASRNLDTFFTDGATTRYLFEQNARGYDISVMEGVMGYYDGVGGTTTRASAYDLAGVTDTPAILIVNSRGMSVSLAAYIKGFTEFKENSHIKGVIFNQMSPMLYPRMKELVEKECKVRVFGYVPKVQDCLIESRHLGLVLPDEIPELKDRLHRLADVLEKTLDIDGILELADQASEMEETKILINYKVDRPVKIGVARDEAFCFIYEDNLRLLKEMGAELVFFSPLHDQKLPEGLIGLLLFGGYPELNAKALSENVSMLSEIRGAIQKGLPCMAECGGFMYLHDEMEDMEGNTYPMVGVISGKAYRTPKLSRFGYVTLKQKKPVFGGSDLGDIPAHEFHYFDSQNCGDAFTAQKPEGRRSWECIHGTDTLLAGYPHFYYYGNPKVAEKFLTKCALYHSAERSVN